MVKRDWSWPLQAALEPRRADARCRRRPFPTVWHLLAWIVMMGTAAQFLVALPG